MTRHANANTHMANYRNKNKDKYNEYIKIQMRKFRIWKKIQIEFLSILL